MIFYYSCMISIDGCCYCCISRRTMDVESWTVEKVLDFIAEEFDDAVAQKFKGMLLTAICGQPLQYQCIYINTSV